MNNEFYQTGVDWRILKGNPSCLNTHRGLKFRQQPAKCVSKNMALPCISNKTAIAFSTKQWTYFIFQAMWKGY